MELVWRVRNSAYSECSLRFDFANGVVLFREKPSHRKPRCIFDGKVSSETAAGVIP